MWNAEIQVIPKSIFSMSDNHAPIIQCTVALPFLEGHTV